MQKIFLVLLALTLMQFTTAASEVTAAINDTPDPNPIPIKPPEAISTNYLIAVGQYEVGFNIASSGFFESGYRTTYGHNLLPGDDYTHYITSLMDDNGSIIYFEVREFKYPVSKNAKNLESDTIEAYSQFTFRTERDGYYGGGGLWVVNYDSPQYHGYQGIIINWPSDKTEIVIQGHLKNRENWRDIWESVNLREKPTNGTK